MPLKIVLMSLFASWSGFGVPYEPSALGNLREVTAEASKVALVDESERRSAEEYAKDHQMTKEAVESRYAATGDIRCPNGYGSAQVTLRNDVVTSAAHVFMHEGNCAQATPPSKCTFVLMVDRKEQTYAIEGASATGFPCPHKGKRLDGQDWIVLKLKKSVDARVKPYHIPKSPELALRDYTPLTVVAKSVDWPLDSREKHIPHRPRHYGDCYARDITTYTDTTGRIETDCDFTHGASGGSMLKTGANPTLIGINQAEYVSVPGAKCDPSHGRQGQASFHAGCWATIATPVAGPFYDAIVKAAGGIPEPAPLSSTPAKTAAPPPIEFNERRSPPAPGEHRSL